MARRKSDEDLFRESTMTFGEHLEELRSRLFKALAWLVVGFVAGLFLARYVVDFIQEPLEKALAKHYKDAAIEKVEQDLKELEEKGFSLPYSPEQLAELVAEEDLLPEEVYLQPSELLRQTERFYREVGRQRRPAIGLLEAAHRLLKRMEPPAEAPEKPPAEAPTTKLSDGERDQLLLALGLLDPADFRAEDRKDQMTQGEFDRLQEDLDRLAATIEEGESLSKEDLARVVRAVGVQKERFQEDATRAGEVTGALQRTRLPGKGPRDKLRRDDLARVFIWKPVENDSRIQTRALNAPEAFMIYIKAALLFGVLVASPGIFWHLWAFVAAGLYYHERRFVYVFGPFSLCLFMAGAALVYYMVFKIVLQFLFTFNNMLGIQIEPRISEWLGFVLILPLGFGIAFQLPLAMLFLERIGIFTVHSYLSKWRIAILVIFILSMLLTPADPGSMLLMAIPLTVLYFGGVLLCRYMPRSRSPYRDAEPEG